MSYEVRIMSAAEQDIAEAQEYFPQESAELGKRWLDEVTSGLEWIAEYAHVPAKGRLDLRKVSTRSFRYRLWYRLNETDRVVQVLAVLHVRRGDDALQRRGV